MTSKKSLMIVLFASAALGQRAEAAQRTYLSDVTGLDCTSNQTVDVRETMSVAAAVILHLPEGTEVHILGGKLTGPFKAFPDTDADFANLWFKIRVKGKIGWVQSGTINCGG